MSLRCPTTSDMPIAASVTPDLVPQMLTDALNLQVTLPFQKIRRLERSLIEQIRMLGRGAFALHAPGVAVEDIQMLGKAGRVTPCDTASSKGHELPVDRLINWLRLDGKSRLISTHGAQLFAATPGYVPLVELRETNGIYVLVVEDLKGAYVYAWPAPGPQAQAAVHQGSITLSLESENEPPAPAM